MDYRQPPADKSNMAKYLFGGFKHCLYPVQKFQSDAERKLSVILEREASKWFKPAKGQFQDLLQVRCRPVPEYQPDFVAETDTVIYMLEPKARTEDDRRRCRRKERRGREMVRPRERPREDLQRQAVEISPYSTRYDRGEYYLGLAGQPVHREVTAPSGLARKHSMSTNTSEKTIWGIHGGRTGDADSLFLKKNFVAIGWSKMGDLGKLKPDRESFKAAVAAAYPEKKPGAIPNNAGQLFRFVHEMKAGDLVAYPSKRDRQIHIGRLEGGYQHNASLEAGYPNLRPVKWLCGVPRTKFSQGALYEIGSALSLFQLKNYAEEFRAAAEGKASAPPVTQDETVAVVAADIEETTRDFILKRLAQELKGHPLADFIAHLLGTMGYRCRVSPEGPDGGIDIIAHKDELGFEPPIIKVQVKSSEGSIGDPVVSALYGKVGVSEFGLLVTLGSFTTQAVNFAKSKSNLRLIDGTELVELVLQHYEQFDSRYKGMLPLKRVFVPEPLDEPEESE
jgi:restriction system protein